MGRPVSTLPMIAEHAQYTEHMQYAKLITMTRCRATLVKMKRRPKKLRKPRWPSLHHRRRREHDISGYDKAVGRGSETPNTQDKEGKYMYVLSHPLHADHGEGKTKSSRNRRRQRFRAASQSGAAYHDRPDQACQKSQARGRSAQGNQKSPEANGACHS